MYVGAQIRAKFPRQDTWQDLTPLSGGQKSIIALAFIFAIQRCDPSPFYLFDEVDDSLDPMYKTAVARLVRTQADAGVQFFTVTFSKQLVEVCDKVYGSRIKKGKKESEIECITKEAALKFVEAEEQQQIRQMRGARGGGGGDEDDGEYEARRPARGQSSPVCLLCPVLWAACGMTRLTGCVCTAYGLAGRGRGREQRGGRGGRGYGGRGGVRRGRVSRGRAAAAGAGSSSSGPARSPRHYWRRGGRGAAPAAASPLRALPSRAQAAVAHGVSRQLSRGVWMDGDRIKNKRIGIIDRCSCCRRWRRLRMMPTNKQGQQQPAVQTTSTRRAPSSRGGAA